MRRSPDRRHGRSRSPRQDGRHGDHRPQPDPIPDLPDELCLRIGVEHPVPPLTRDLVMQEIDRVGAGHKITTICMEGTDPKHPTYQWARVYFPTTDDADHAVTMLNMPNRSWRWKHVVTQKLPLVGANSPDCFGDPTFSAYVEDPPDCIAIDTQEGLVYFCTDELFRSKGLLDFREARRSGKCIRRLICKHFDPEKRAPCRYGPECSFIHVKAAYMNRLLRTVPHQQPLRLSHAKDDEIQISAWEYARRQDTLVVRELEPTLDDKGLKYMFEDCGGYTASFIRQDDHVRYGIVRFQEPTHAANALIQTFGSGLNVSFWGVMEDIRSIQTREARDNPQYEAEHRRRREAAAPLPAVASQGQPPSGQAVPFPPLPDGWTYGVSRSSNKYYFYQTSQKEKTTWKHPTTGEGYRA